MKTVKVRLTKDFLNKVRDEINLILFQIKGFGLKEMLLANEILRGLQDAKIDICY